MPLLKGYGSLILWAIGQIVVAAAIWGGIKADIRAIHMEIKTRHEANMLRHTELQSSVNEAHSRIDKLLFARRSTDRDP